MKRFLLALLSVLLLSCSSAKKPADTSSADVDFTTMSKTIIFATMVNMIENPQEHIGQSVKMPGLFSVDVNDDGSSYVECYVMDGTQCCSQGIEVRFASKKDDERAQELDQSEAVIYGIFDTYREDGHTYCVLKDTVILEASSSL